MHSMHFARLILAELFYRAACVAESMQLHLKLGTKNKMKLIWIISDLWYLDFITWHQYFLLGMTTHVALFCILLVGEYLWEFIHVHPIV